MDFWRFIEAHATAAPSLEAACSALDVALREVTEPQVLAYCDAFYEAMDRAYTWDLWGVAYLIQGGCSDDAFMDFRAGLIACGQDIFEKAVADPESLMSIPQANLSALFDEGMLYVGPAVYESMSGQAFERRAGSNDPRGEPWEESRENLMQRFPRAWAAYGWEESPGPELSTQPAKPWWKIW